MKSRTSLIYYNELSDIRRILNSITERSKAAEHDRRVYNKLRNDLERARNEYATLATQIHESDPATHYSHQQMLDDLLAYIEGTEYDLNEIGAAEEEPANTVIDPKEQLLQLRYRNAISTANKYNNSYLPNNNEENVYMTNPANETSIGYNLNYSNEELAAAERSKVERAEYERQQQQRAVPIFRKTTYRRPNMRNKSRSRWGPIQRGLRNRTQRKLQYPASNNIRKYFPPKKAGGSGSRVSRTRRRTYKAGRK